MTIPSDSLTSLLNLLHNDFAVPWSVLMLILGRRTKPISAIKKLFGWVGEIVDAFYEFKTRCAESKARHTSFCTRTHAARSIEPDAGTAV